MESLVWTEQSVYSLNLFGLGLCIGYNQAYSAFENDPIQHKTSGNGEKGP